MKGVVIKGAAMLIPLQIDRRTRPASERMLPLALDPEIDNLLARPTMRQVEVDPDLQTVSKIEMWIKVQVVDEVSQVILETLNNKYY